jgi:hypothetical protein
VSKLNGADIYLFWQVAATLSDEGLNIDASIHFRNDQTLEVLPIGIHGELRNGYTPMAVWRVTVGLVWRYCSATFPRC